MWTDNTIIRFGMGLQLAIENKKKLGKNYWKKKLYMLL